MQPVQFAKRHRKLTAVIAVLGIVAATAPWRVFYLKLAYWLRPSPAARLRTLTDLVDLRSSLARSEFEHATAEQTVMGAWGLAVIGDERGVALLAQLADSPRRAYYKWDPGLVFAEVISEKAPERNFEEWWVANRNKASFDGSTGKWKVR